MKGTVSHLTINGCKIIGSLHDSQEIKQEQLILQALNLPTEISHQNQIYFSDGFTFLLLTVAESEFNSINQYLKKNLKPIVSVEKYQFKENKFFISKISFIYTDLDFLIGKPLEYDIYCLSDYSNPDGSNEIPKQIYQNKSNLGVKKESNLNEQQYNPIHSLYPSQFGWTLKARVTTKSGIREFEGKNNKNSRQSQSASKVFSVDIIDWTGAEISCSFFNDAAEKFYSILQEGNVYEFSNGVVKLANQNYTFDHNAGIKLLDNDTTIDEKTFEFSKIKDIKDFKKDKIIDVVGIVLEDSQLSQVQLKNGSSTSQKKIHIYDDSLIKVEVTLWGAMAENAMPKGSVVVIKGARVSEFKEVKNLAILFSGKVFVNNTSIKEVQDLIQWKGIPENASKEIESMGEYKSTNIVFELSSIKKMEEDAEQLMSQNIPDDKKIAQHNICAYITYLNPERDLLYASCPTKDCQKKVIIKADNSIECPKCGHMNKQPIFRYLFSARITDYTSSIFANVFEKQGIVIFDQTATQLKEIKDSFEPNQFAARIQESLFKEFVFKIQTKVETYQGTSRIKHAVQSMYEPNSKKINSSLASQIELYI